MGKEDEPDFELEMLRQAALNSLQRNRAKQLPQEVSHHRPTPTNTNLIEIQTTSSLLEDPELVEEIVIAEGLDIDDSDCDEVIEETILSDEDGEEDTVDGNNEEPSRVPSEGESPENGDGETESENAVENATLEMNAENEDSSTDDDALSVASKYSLFEEESLDEILQDNVKRRLANRGGQQTAQKKEDSPSKHSSGRKRSTSRGKDRSRTRSPIVFRGGRKRRTRSRSPFMNRRRPIPARRSRSRSREIRRRSVDRDARDRIDRDRDRNIIESRDKSRRKEDIRRPNRSSHSPSHTKATRRDRDQQQHVSSRRRSRSNSRERIRTKPNNNNIHSNRPPPASLSASKDKKTEVQTSTSSRPSNPSPEPSIPDGVDKEVFEKRRKKFQEQAPLNRVQGKKILLHSKTGEMPSEASKPNESSKQHQPKLSPDRRTNDRNPSSSSVQSRLSNKEKVLADSSKESLNSTSSGRVRDEKSRKRKSSDDLSIEDNVDDVRSNKIRDERVKAPVKNVENEDEEDQQEDLRAKLIKRKLRAQQGQHLGGSGRIFTEALKGTRLLSTVVAATNSNSRRKESSSSSSKKQVARKVSLVKS